MVYRILPIHTFHAWQILTTLITLNFHGNVNDFDGRNGSSIFTTNEKYNKFPSTEHIFCLCYLSSTSKRNFDVSIKCFKFWSSVFQHSRDLICIPLISPPHPKQKTTICTHRSLGRNNCRTHACLNSLDRLGSVITALCQL